MKILVISDSHRSVYNIKDVLSLISGSIDYVFYLGDIVEDIKPFVSMYEGVRFHYVSGNCDFGSMSNKDEIVIVNNRTVWLTHGHMQYVKSGYDRLTYAAEEKQVHICLFGHTHVPIIFEYNNILYMNPGSISEPRGRINNPTYGILDINEAGEASAQIVAIYGKGIYKPISIEHVKI